MLICLSRCIYLRTCMYVYLCTQQIIFYMFHDACIRFMYILVYVSKYPHDVILVSAVQHYQDYNNHSIPGTVMC